MINFFIKFFIYNDDIKLLKSSFLLPFLTTMIGSFVILLSFSVMEGFSKTLKETIYTFDKQNSLEINKEIINNENSNNLEILINFLNDKDYIYNIYEERVMFFENQRIPFVGKVYGLYDFDNFLKNNFLSLNHKNKITPKSCIIGHQQLINANFNINDNINFVSFSDFNNISSIPNVEHKIVNVLKTNIPQYDNSLFIPYDSILFNKNILLKINLNKKIENTDLLKIQSKFKNGITFFDDLYMFNDLFAAIDFEKISYISFGFFIIIISSIMVMGYNISSILRHAKSIALLQTLGLSKKNISMLYLLFSSSITICGFCLALFLVYLFIYFDKYFLIMDYIFDPEIYFNFNLIINSNIILYTFIFNIISMLISTILPMYKISKLDMIESLKVRL